MSDETASSPPRIGTASLSAFDLHNSKRVSLIVIGFGVHVVVGTLLFLTFASAAALIHYAMHHLDDVTPVFVPDDMRVGLVMGA